MTLVHMVLVYVILAHEVWVHVTCVMGGFGRCGCMWVYVLCVMWVDVVCVHVVGLYGVCVWCR